MNYVKICPTCNKSIARTPLVEILVSYRGDLTQSEIYEQGWHLKCYPSVAALTEGIGVEADKDFADELDGIALILGTAFPTIGNGLRAKAQAIRAAIALAYGK